jgi:mycofactocin system transcriptional regulator
MTAPFVQVGSTTHVDVVKISVRIWHRVPEWKGEAMAQQPRVGRRRSTTPQHIAEVALGLFADRGFSQVSVDDVAHAAGIARRTVFRYYASKNAIPWGDFDAHLHHLRNLLDHVALDVPLGEALRTALLTFNTFDESETVRHRQRMRVILQTPELQAYSMTMYAGWREVIAIFVAHRTGGRTGDLRPQTVAWMMLAVALSAYEHWLEDPAVSLPQALGDAFDVVRAGLDELDQSAHADGARVQE